jgi:hypothetical protein
MSLLDFHSETKGEREERRETNRVKSLGQKQEQAQETTLEQTPPESKPEKDNGIYLWITDFKNEHDGQEVHTGDAALDPLAEETEGEREGHPVENSDPAFPWKTNFTSRKPSAPFEPHVVETVEGAGFSFEITHSAQDQYYGVVRFRSDNRTLSLVHANQNHLRSSLYVLAAQNVTQADLSDGSIRNNANAGLDVDFFD